CCSINSELVCYVVYSDPLFSQLHYVAIALFSQLLIPALERSTSEQPPDVISGYISITHSHLFCYLFGSSAKFEKLLYFFISLFVMSASYLTLGLPDHPFYWHC